MSQIKENPWTVYCASKPEGEVVKACWISELGIREEHICKAVFESPAAYRMVSPEGTRDVLKANCLDFMCIKIEVK
jgi:hypothetical protein